VASPKRSDDDGVQENMIRKVEKRAIMTGDYKLFIDFIIGEKEFFDLMRDPEELHNNYDGNRKVAYERESILNAYSTRDRSKMGSRNVKERITKFKNLERLYSTVV